MYILDSGSAGADIDGNYYVPCNRYTGYANIVGFDCSGHGVVVDACRYLSEAVGEENGCFVAEVGWT